MSYEPTSAVDELGRQAAEELEELLDSLARLAGSDLDPGPFYQALLEGAVRGLAATGGAIWIRDPAGQIRAQSLVQLDALVVAQNWADAQRHTQLIDQAIIIGAPRAVPPRSTLPGAAQALNPSDHLLLLSPVAVDSGAGLVEVFQRPTAATVGNQGALNFLTALCELAAEYQRNAQLRRLRDRESLWGQFERFTQQVHGSLSSRAVAYTIAGDGRTLIGCDRLSVALARGRRAKALAITGVDQLDRRSESVRRLEELAARVCTMREPLWHAAGDAPLAPQLQTPLDALVDESHAQAVAVVPLVDPAAAALGADSGDATAQAAASKPLGALIVERFEGGPFTDAERQRIDAVARQSAVALRNAQVYEHVPLSPLWRGLEKAGWLRWARQAPKTVLALAAAVAVALFLTLMPADFEISAKGQLQPVQRREVFARSDGIVQDVNVQHGDRVTAGQMLVTLRKPQLDFETSRLDGEINDAQTKLASIQASLTAAGHDAAAGSEQKVNQLSAEGEEVKSLLQSLERQRTVLAKQRDDLALRSPMAGTVLTWDAANLLAARPVARGQALLTVADLDGPWEIESQVADNRIGHVLEAQNQLHEQHAGDELAASFRMATEPGATHQGKVRQVALASESDKVTGSTVRVTIGFDRSEVPADQLRPGATAVVKIHCGRQSIGYVWLHEFWEFLQERVFF